VPDCGELFREGRLVHNGLTLAIVGPAECGQGHRCFNRLVGARGVRFVTATPGTTAVTLVTEPAFSLGGIPVELVDTAGLAREEPRK